MTCVHNQSATMVPMNEQLPPPAFNGERLRHAREEKGWSRGKLASILDCSVTSIAGWERSVHMPKPDMLRKLADTLDLALMDLLRAPRAQWGLVEHRLMLGQDQDAMAKAINVSRPRFSSFEMGYVEPSEEQYEQLAFHYGTTAGELRDGWVRNHKRMISGP